MNVYHKLLEPDDYYLGRCLTNIDVNSDDFVILLPHFSISDPSEDIDVK